ncbi:hypothetical protein SNEBB_010824 [Seison nebaliae]|nr:hypothetical protein SNEBB_010824 [Seison nebaliae]
MRNFNEENDPNSFIDHKYTSEKRQHFLKEIQGDLSTFNDTQNILLTSSPVPKSVNKLKRIIIHDQIGSVKDKRKRFKKIFMLNDIDDDLIIDDDDDIIIENEKNVLSIDDEVGESIMINGRNDSIGKKSVKMNGKIKTISDDKNLIGNYIGKKVDDKGKMNVNEKEKKKKFVHPIDKKEIDEEIIISDNDEDYNPDFQPSHLDDNESTLDEQEYFQENCDDWNMADELNNLEADLKMSVDDLKKQYDGIDTISPLPEYLPISKDKYNRLKTLKTLNDDSDTDIMIINSDDTLENKSEEEQDKPRVLRTRKQILQNKDQSMKRENNDCIIISSDSSPSSSSNEEKNESRTKINKKKKKISLRDFYQEMLDGKKEDRNYQPNWRNYTSIGHEHQAIIPKFQTTNVKLEKLERSKGETIKNNLALQPIVSTFDSGRFLHIPIDYSNNPTKNDWLLWDGSHEMNKDKRMLNSFLTISSNYFGNSQIIDNVYRRGKYEERKFQELNIDRQLERFVNGKIDSLSDMSQRKFSSCEEYDHDDEFTLYILMRCQFNYVNAMDLVIRYGKIFNLMTKQYLNLHSPVIKLKHERLIDILDIPHLPLRSIFVSNDKFVKQFDKESLKSIQEYREKKRSYSTDLRQFDFELNNEEMKYSGYKLNIPWTTYDIELYKKGLLTHAKAFHQIQKEFLPWRCTKELIEFYYHWKMTPNYQVLREQANIERENILNETIPTEEPLTQLESVMKIPSISKLKAATYHIIPREVNLI